MKRFAVSCVVAVLGASCGAAYASDAERQRLEAQGQIEEARRLAEEAEKRRAHGGLQHPVVRDPDPREPPLSVEGLFEHAAFLERQGRGPEAVKIYVRAARRGSADAARRLFEIYNKGIPGVERDYVESLKWANVARVLERRDFVR